ncbi:hypothetical protein CDG76_31295 [Nostoc sp. 'Peltigera membranacea cyanobiont' 210A]|uniref:Uncharacterized protein n=1 Tax=Nostoc punctiforme NIES-2108 TaxID=1356359 RepID=A0A367RT26_NOSPU|nr:hypothetical protein CDG76_31295 [Nostoc sp. 'Peltigera membranacea cyanobiont' 210A]RCJ38860.1 hypothetical protein A6769_07420 [Nostoc punctiforme NIES-2108]
MAQTCNQGIFNEEAGEMTPDSCCEAPAEQGSESPTSIKLLLSGFRSGGVESPSFEHLPPHNDYHSWLNICFQFF